MRRLQALLVLVFAGPALGADLHYGPVEDLESIDAKTTLSGARKTIDIAAGAVTAWPIINALSEAARHGTVVRLLVDGAQARNADMTPDGPFGVLLGRATITVKHKRADGAGMSLNSYCVDARWFRTGSAAFTAAGLHHQDGDLLLFDDHELCGNFAAEFDRIWSGDAQ